MSKQVVTVGTTEGIHDGVLKIASAIVGTTNLSPCKLLKFPDMNDISNYSVLTFPGDGMHNGSSQPNITYDASGGFVYVAFGYMDGSDDGRIKIDKIDITATPPTRTELCDFVCGTNGFVPLIAALTNDGTHIYGITKVTLENCWVFKVKISDGTRPVAPVQVTGTGHVRGHTIGYDSVTSKLYFSGTRLTPKLSWVGSCALDLTGLATNDISTTKGLSDDLTFIGTSFFLNHENEDSPSGSILKVAKSDLSFTTHSCGLNVAMDGHYYDGVGLWVVADTNPSTLVKFNPTTGAVIQTLSMATGETHINEIHPGKDSGHVFLSNYGGPPNKVWMFPLDGSGGDPAGPVGLSAVDWFRRKKKLKFK